MTSLFLQTLQAKPARTAREVRHLHRVRELQHELFGLQWTWHSRHLLVNAPSLRRETTCRALAETVEADWIERATLFASGGFGVHELGPHGLLAGLGGATLGVLAGWATTANLVRLRGEELGPLDLMQTYFSVAEALHLPRVENGLHVTRDPPYRLLLETSEGSRYLETPEEALVHLRLPGESTRMQVREAIFEKMERLRRTEDLGATTYADLLMVHWDALREQFEDDTP